MAEQRTSDSETSQQDPRVTAPVELPKADLLSEWFTGKVESDRSERDRPSTSYNEYAVYVRYNDS